MPFWRCYYHVIWTTRYREPRSFPEYESILYAAIEKKSEELGCPVLAINGVSDHIHVAVNIRPGIAVGQWAGTVKGVSSRTLNSTFELTERFRWQPGYGVLTFGARRLSFVQDYIARQKDHHANGELEPYLEQIEDG
jgi:REP element-mobilizing transposase RayT